jgi:hypothetical protein
MKMLSIQLAEEGKAYQALRLMYIFLRIVFISEYQSRKVPHRGGGGNVNMMKFTYTTRKMEI